MDDLVERLRGLARWLDEVGFPVNSGLVLGAASELLRLRAALAAAEKERDAPKMESGWLIEHGASEPSHPRYWGGVYGWTYDNLKAVRFTREADARSQAEAMDDGVPENYRIAEHGADVDVGKLHDWFVPEFLTYECCRKCGIVRRRDDRNKPCPGVVRVGPRHLSGKESK